MKNLYAQEPKLSHTQFQKFLFFNLLVTFRLYIAFEKRNAKEGQIGKGGKRNKKYDEGEKEIRLAS